MGESLDLYWRPIRRLLHLFLGKLATGKLWPGTGGDLAMIAVTFAEPLESRVSEGEPSGAGAQLIPLELLLSKVGLASARGDDEEDTPIPEEPQVHEADMQECGICLDR